MKPEIKTDRVSIVLLGAFNPRIFHPSWLEVRELISPGQAKKADITIVHADLTQFITAYMTFDIQPSRFSVKCDTIHKDVIKDLVLTAFGEHLPHSPVWRFGINRAITFSCGSESIRNAFGKQLAPRDAWGPWGASIEQASTARNLHGGLMRLVMRQMPRPDGLHGYIQADIRPESGDSSDVFVDINNDFVLGDREATMGCSDAMEILSDKWLDSLEGAKAIVDGLVATVENLS